MDTPHITYSLDSLPELLGARQFQLLINALGLREAVREAQATVSKFDAGSYVASQIILKHEAHLQDREAEYAKRTSPDPEVSQPQQPCDESGVAGQAA